MAAQVKSQQFIVDARGKPRAVVLSIMDYRKLVRLMEDHKDATALKRAMRTSRGTVSHAQLLEHLKRQRLI